MCQTIISPCISNIFHLAIKTGRYTLEKRTKNTAEVNQMKTLDKIEENQGQEKLKDRTEAIENIVEQITANHRSQLPNSPQFYDKLNKMQTEFLVSFS